MRQAPAFILLAAVVVVGPAASRCEGAGGALAFSVDCNFPGGNIVVEKVDGDTVRVRQDLRDTAGDWFYWHFRVCGAGGRTVTFQFTRGDIIGPMGPACSTDGGKTWKWLGRSAVKTPTQPSQPAPATGPGAATRPGKLAAFSFPFPAGADDVRFCLSIPYTEANLKEFLAAYRDRADLKAGTLCKTRKGRQAEVLYAGRMDASADYRIAFTCRHHACEMIASYVLEGILEAVLSDTEDGKWYRGHVAVLAVPFMDKDGVEDGDQGKNRKPHDHNRDYAGESVHPTVAAVKKLLPEWSGGKLDVAIDLHCPSLRDSVIQFIGGPNQEVWGRVERLGEVLQTIQKGPLLYAVKDNLAYGKSWNTGSGELMSFGRWASGLPNIFIATTIETPYSSIKGKPVTPDGARAFGRDVAVALRQFLQKESPRNAPGK